MRKNNKTTWLTKEGKYVELKDMEDTHLRNTISYLERHPNWRKTSLQPLKNELDRRTSILYKNIPPKDSLDDLFEERIE